MVMIKELHYEKDNKNNYQERIINYSSWEDYCKDIQEVDGTAHKLTYPSLPRQTKIRNFTYENENKIIFELTMKNNGMEIIGVSELVNTIPLKN